MIYLKNNYSFLSNISTAFVLALACLGFIKNIVFLGKVDLPILYPLILILFLYLVFNFKYLKEFLNKLNLNNVLIKNNSFVVKKVIG